MPDRLNRLDIDSHDPGAFQDEDRLLVEEVARIVGGFLEAHPRGSLATQSNLDLKP
jgi:hypothetical protein